MRLSAWQASAQFTPFSGRGSAGGTTNLQSFLRLGFHHQHHAPIAADEMANSEQFPGFAWALFAWAPFAWAPFAWAKRDWRDPAG
jgi:hypothetical protein